MYKRSKRYPELFRKSESGPWWCFLPRVGAGRMPRASTGQRDEQAAHAWYLRRVREPESPAGSVSASGKKERSLERALEARLEWLRVARLHDDPTRKKLSAATIDFYTAKGRALISVLGADTLLSDIGHEQIRAYIVKRSETASGSSIGKELTTLSMAMRLARKDGIACPVFKDIVPEDFHALYVPKQRWLSEAEVDALLGVLQPKRAAVVAFIVATSATYPSEVSPVRPGDVNPKTYVVHVKGTKRGTRDRFLKVPSHARRFLDLAVKHLGPSGPGA